MDAATAGGVICTKGLGGDLVSTEGVLVEGERREAGRGTSSGKSSESMDAATAGDDICTKGVGVDLDSIEGVLVDGE